MKAKNENEVFRNVSYQLPTHLHEELKKSAKANRRSINGELAFILQEYLFMSLANLAEANLTDNNLEDERVGKKKGMKFLIERIFESLEKLNDINLKGYELEWEINWAIKLNRIAEIMVVEGYAALVKAVKKL
jgi:hypothetical protein